MNAGKLLILSRQLVARSDLRQSTPHHLLIGFASSTDIADLQHQGPVGDFDRSQQRADPLDFFGIDSDP